MALEFVEFTLNWIEFEVFECTDFSQPLEYVVLETVAARWAKPEIMSERASPPRALKRPASSERIRRSPAPKRTALELVSEIVEREIDVHELHDVLAALLLSYHRQQKAQRATA